MRGTFKAGAGAVGVVALSGILLAPGVASAAPSTVYVGQAELAACTAQSTAVCSFTQGTGGATVKGTVPNGVVELSTPGGSDKIDVVDLSMRGKKLSEITNLAYDSTVTQDGPIAGQAPAIKIEINPKKAGSTYTTLVWEPIYTDTPSALNVAKHFTPSNGTAGAGGWWASGALTNIGTPNKYGFNTHTATFAEVKDALPDAEIISVRVGQGSGSAGLKSEVDKVVVNEQTLDFEAHPPVPANARADLQVSLTMPQTARAGQDVKAVVKVKNNGPTAAGTTTTKYTVPGGYTVKNGGPTVFTTDYIAAGQTLTYEVTLTVPSGRRITGSSAYATSVSVDPRLTNNIAAAVTVSY